MQGTLLQQFLNRPLFCVALAAAVVPFRAAGQFYVATFNDGSSIQPGWNEITPSSTTSTASWDGTQNASAPAGGSMHVRVNWDSDGFAYMWQDSKISFDLSPAASGISYDRLAVDIKVNSGGNTLYSGVQLVCQSWTGGPQYSWVSLDTLWFQNTADWQHLSASLASFPAPIDRVVLNLFYMDYAGGSSASGTSDYWIDNVTLTAVPEPYGLALLGLGVAAASRAIKRARE